MEIMNGTGYDKDSPQQKIKDFYLSALNVEERNRLGAEPAKKYLDALDAVETVKDLSASQIFSLKENASGGLIGYVYMPDYRDSSKRIASVGVPFEAMNTKEEFQDPENEILPGCKAAAVHASGAWRGKQGAGGHACRGLYEILGKTVGI